MEYQKLIDFLDKIINQPIIMNYFLELYRHNKKNKTWLKLL